MGYRLRGCNAGALLNDCGCRDGSEGLVPCRMTTLMLQSNRGSHIVELLMGRP